MFLSYAYVLTSSHNAQHGKAKQRLSPLSIPTCQGQSNCLSAFGPLTLCLRGYYLLEIRTSKSMDWILNADNIDSVILPVQLAKDALNMELNAQDIVMSRSSSFAMRIQPRSRSERRGHNKRLLSSQSSHSTHLHRLLLLLQIVMLLHHRLSLKMTAN
jgi:hypothetical protein